MRNAELVTGDEKRTARWKKHRALCSTTNCQRILLMDEDRQVTIESGTMEDTGGFTRFPGKEGLGGGHRDGEGWAR